MLLTSWLRGWFARANAQRDNGQWTRRRPRPHEPRRRMAPAVEALENRQLLTVFEVTTFNDVIAADGVLSLREAIIAANNAQGEHTIELPTGTYALSQSGAGEDAAVTGDLDITALPESVTIRGTGATQVFIDGGDLDRVFDVLMGADLNLIGLTVQNGLLTSGDGAGIRSLGNLSLDGVTVTGNSGLSGTVNGGGIAINGGFARITDSLISVNDVTGDGGGLFLTAGLTDLVRTQLNSNTSGDAGGAIRNQGTKRRNSCRNG